MKTQPEFLVWLVRLKQWTCQTTESLSNVPWGFTHAPTLPLWNLNYLIFPSYRTWTCLAEYLVHCFRRAWGSLLHMLTKVIVLLRMALSYKGETLYPFIICVVYQETDDFKLMDFMIHWVILVDNKKAPQWNSLISFQWLSPTGVFVVISQHCTTHWYCSFTLYMSALFLSTYWVILFLPHTSPFRDEAWLLESQVKSKARRKE